MLRLGEMKMNMLTNWLPLAAMTQEEKELFVGLSDWYCLQSETEHKEPVWAVIGSEFCLHRQSSNIIPRLKLKEGEWYTFQFRDDKDNQTAELSEIRGSEVFFKGEPLDFGYSKKGLTLLRPATQEEIDRVKPKFKRGDVVEQIALYRIGFCWINEGGDFEFCDSGSRMLDRDSLEQRTATKATPDQIKQLELEEMKHGKKWNGEGYDEFLTYDGLTLNELLEHDLSEIDIRSIGGQWSVTHGNTKEDLIEFAVADYENEIKTLRLKPKETKEQIRIKELEEELEECYDRINGMAEFFAEQEKRAQDFCYKVVKVGE